MNHKKRRERGFTLIEIIITLVIVSFVSVMLFTYSGSKSFIGSVTPVQRIQTASTIHQIMEMITADYQGYPRWKPGVTYTTGSRVTPIKRNGYFYQPVANCTSGAAEPSPWNTTDGSLSSEGGSGCSWRLTYQPVVTNPYPNPILPLSELRRKIAGLAAGSAVPSDGREGQTVYYNNIPATGMQYAIVNNRYIDPAASWDTASVSATAYLKVTLRSAGGGEQLTVIFTD
ncbi:MAG: prepilin-type N-terminal cleavage/methylation domain-containing protein [Thermodesulfobacteriota bacterium]